MASAQPRTSSRSLFNQLGILPVPCQYIISVTNFVISNQENFQTHSSINSINTNNKYHLHRPNANPSCFKKRTFDAGIKIFNSLPPSLSILKNDKVKFKVALKKYLLTHSFYSADEFFMFNDNP